MNDSELQRQTTQVPSTAPQPKARPTLANLRVVYPHALTANIALQHPKATLGRQPDDATPPLLHPLISRKHVQIAWHAEQHLHTAVDLGSRNGATVDGMRAIDPVALRHGSVLRVGPALLVYERDDEGPHAAVSDSTPTSAIVGTSNAAQRLRAAIARIAGDPATVLLCGETGTGKEFIADELHRSSGRRGKLVAVNCAALSAQLIESELFGHVRGAFSGALQDQPGLFRAAEGGTLFLDEIGELDCSLQPKLLRALQDHVVRPVGATRDVRVDVRVIAATNRNLAEMATRGAFRRDLYARLALRELAVPGLQARRADVFVWMELLHAAFCKLRDLPAPTPFVFTTAAAEAVLRCDFPDNLRGLDRLVHHLADLERRHAHPSALDLDALPQWLWQRRSAVPPVKADTQPVAAVPADSSQAHASAPSPSARPRSPIPSRDELEHMLAANGGSIRATAKHFGRDRKQIHRWLEAFGIKHA